MNSTLLLRATGISVVAALGLAACGSNSNGTPAGPGGSSSPTSSSACATGSVTGQGSTFQANIEKQWISQFAGQCSGANITYTGTGSGAGIQQFGSGTIDYAGSDATMKPDEQSAADKRCGNPALHIPVTAGGVAIIFNVKGVTSLNLSAATLAGIFDGSIKTWDASQIKADNPGVTLPPTAIKTYHRSDGSGTTKVFTGFLKAVAPSVWKLGSDKSITWPSGLGANGSSGVVQGVKSTDGGITYAEVSYAKQDNLPTAKVKGAQGDFTDISSSTVSQSIDSGFTISGTGNDLAGKLDFTKMTGYPISTVSYVFVCSHYSDAA
ncbi:MAG: phosphate transport system substrate-binding protein [Frankiaceae bacterium]|nr:phosphate transport system substrate-binding protein [Frankiaceae bacterium]